MIVYYIHDIIITVSYALQNLDRKTILKIIIYFQSTLKQNTIISQLYYGKVFIRKHGNNTILHRTSLEIG